MTHIAIISARRPHNVPKMQAYAPTATWYVAEGETADYQAAGATSVIEAGDLISARNTALQAAFALGEPCLQLSDDLGGLLLVNPDKTTSPLTVDEAARFLHMMCQRTGAKLAGTAPVANTFYIDPTKPVRTQHFIVGDLIYVLPSEPRFDPGLRLKEDYDFTAQHIRTYGAVARVDVVMAKFAHRTNKGGAVSYRTEAAEQEAITYLKAKWPGVIVDNPRRPNEVLFKGERV